MQFWRRLVEKAEADRIDTDRDAAEQFFATLPLRTYEFDWDAWRQSFAVLRWFARQRLSTGVARERLPDPVDVALTRVLSGLIPGMLRLTLIPLNDRPKRKQVDWNVRIGFHLTNRAGEKVQSMHSGDQTTFWQAVFLEFFNGESATGSFQLPSVCVECGAGLPDTPALGKRSRRKLCDRCGMKMSRRKDPEKHRAADRERKRQERAELKRSKNPKRK